MPTQDPLESPARRVIDRIVEQRFTGVLRVSSHEASGELWFLAGILEDARFGVSKGDEALERLLRATQVFFQAELRLPHLSGGFKKPMPQTGTFAEIRPVVLMRYCESYALTCSLELKGKERTVRIAYRTGELLSADAASAGNEVLAGMLESEEGSYEIVLPTFELPPDVNAAPAAASIPKLSLAERIDQSLSEQSAEEAKASAELKATTQREAEAAAAEARRKAEQASAAEARRKADEASAAAEAKRKADEASAAEAKRKADEAAAEAKRKADEASAALARRRADEAAAEARRKADEASVALARRKADEAAAEAKRKANEAAAERAKRVADEASAALAKRKADEAAEAKRVADEAAAAQAKRVADEAAAEKAKRAADEAAAVAARRDADELVSAAERERSPKQPRIDESLTERDREDSQPPNIVARKGGFPWLWLFLALLLVGLAYFARERLGLR